MKPLPFAAAGPSIMQAEQFISGDPPTLCCGEPPLLTSPGPSSASSISLSSRDGASRAASLAGGRQPAQLVGIVSVVCNETQAHAHHAMSLSEEGHTIPGTRRGAALKYM